MLALGSPSLSAVLCSFPPPQALFSSPPLPLPLSPFLFLFLSPSFFFLQAGVRQRYSKFLEKKKKQHDHHLPPYSSLLSLPGDVLGCGGPCFLVSSLSRARCPSSSSRAHNLLKSPASLAGTAGVSVRSGTGPLTLLDARRGLHALYSRTNTPVYHDGLALLRPGALGRMSRPPLGARPCLSSSSNIRRRQGTQGQRQAGVGLWTEKVDIVCK